MLSLYDVYATVHDKCTCKYFKSFSIQGSHCTGKTGKIVKSNSRQGKHREYENFGKTQGKHREFENFGKTQGKHREFENFTMILKSNSHLHSHAAGRDCCKGRWRPKYNYRLCYYVHPPGGWIYYFCFFRRPMSDVRCPMSGVRRPMSGVTHGFRSFKGKVLELLSPNLVCRLIGSVACLGLLLAVVPLLLTE